MNRENLKKFHFNWAPIVMHLNFSSTEILMFLLITALASLVAVYFLSKLLVKVFKMRIKAVYVAVICLSLHNLIALALEFSSASTLIAYVTTPFLIIFFVVLFFTKVLR